MPRKKWSRKNSRDRNVEQFAKDQTPPVSSARIRKLLTEGRVRGAKQESDGWHFSPNARIVPVRKSPTKLVNPLKRDGEIDAEEYAEIHEVTRQRVYELLKAGRIEGARFTDAGWVIPRDAEWPGVPPDERPEVSPYVGAPRKKVSILEGPPDSPKMPPIPPHMETPVID